jgi:SAM-dependent methyltransferase
MTDAFVVDYGADTGSRLKHFSVAADCEYWTRRWRGARDVSYERERSGHLPHQLRETWRRSVEPGSRVLEAGCGLGHFSVAAHALGFRAEGIDWSEPTIDRLRQAFPSIPWHVGDVRRLPFPDGSFDSVYSPGVCEHFEEGPVAILEETRRVLRTGGIAVVSTPCFNPWIRRRSSLFASRETPAGLAFFEYAFASDGMARLLERLGFEMLQIRPYGALETLERYAGWRVPGRVKRPLAFSLDYLPVVRDWGSTCIWLARKR